MADNSQKRKIERKKGEIESLSLAYFNGIISAEEYDGKLIKLTLELSELERNEGFPVQPFANL